MTYTAPALLALVTAKDACASGHKTGGQLDSRNEKLIDSIHHFLVSTDAAWFAILDPGRTPLPGDITKAAE